MINTSKNILNWILMVVLVMGFGEVSGKGIKPLKITGEEIGVLPIAPGITPSSASFCFNATNTGVFTVSGAPAGSTYQWIQRPGATFISGATSNVFTSTATAVGTYTYTCIVYTGSPSVADTLNNVVLTIKALPSVTVSASDNSICVGFSSVLTANGADSYVWSPSTALSSTTTNPVTANPTTTTTYTVTGTVSNGCKNTASTTITVNTNPSTPAITATPITICSGGSIAFSTPAIAGQTFSWDYGDGTTNGTGTSVNHTYNLASTGNGSQGFNVILTTTISATGCKSTRTQGVTVKELPDATLGDFSDQTPFSVCDGDIVNFLEVTNLSTTNNTNYLINWGDASANFTATGTWLVNTGIATHTYSSSGYTTLTFTVTGNNGCVNTKTYNIYKGSNPAVPFSNPGNTVGQCAPYTLTLPSQNNTNPPGTIYIATLNDGTPVETFSTLPVQYVHIFNNTSCGATGGLTPNTYKLTIRAQNPCGFSDLTIEPITINKKPKANFTISPDTIVCNNQLVTFTNTSTDGVTVSNSGVCTYTSPNNWVITPSTGYTISSGTLGNSTPTNNPATWGSAILTATFNTPGTYEISNFVRNSCGTDTITKTICVQKPPTPSFTSSTNNGCVPFTTTLASTSTDLPVCGPLKYKWTVTQTSSTCTAATTPDYLFTTGNDSSVVPAPVIKFNNEGVYNIVLTLTNKCGSFSTPAKIVTAKTKPQISINALADICAGGTASPTATILSCGGTIPPATGYSWTFANGTPASSTAQTPGTITYSTANTTNAISLNVTNECGTTTTNSNIIVKPIPAVNLVNNFTKCAGESLGPINFSGTSGATFNWTNSNTAIGLSASGTGDISAFTVTNSSSSPLTSTITITPIKDGCNGPIKTFTITVNPLPNVTATPTSASICSGSTGTTITASGADTYTWSPATGLNTTTGNSVIANPTATTTTYTVVGQITATGCKNSASSIITVKPSPVIAATFINPTSCNTSTGSITISGLTSGLTYTLNYTNGTNNVSQNINPTSSTHVISSLPAGNYSNISVTLNGCPSNVITSIALSDPNPPATPTAGSNTPLCSGQTLNLTANTTTGGSATWSWSGPNGFTSTLQNPSIIGATTAASGIYSVTVKIAGCSSPAGQTTVLVNQTPAPPTASSNTPVCSGNTLTLTASTSTIPVIWSWSGPASFTSTQQNPQVSASATTAMNGTYNVTATANYTFPTLSCQSTSSSISVLVKPTPIITSSSSTNPTNCSTSTGSILLNGLTASTSYVVNYTNPSGALITTTITSSSTGVITIPSLPAGSYSNVYVLLNNCPSVSVGPFSLSDPNPPATPTITNVNPLCSGNTLNLITSTTSTGTQTWSWNGPNSFTSTQQNPSIINATTLATGTYSVTVTISGCTSPSATINVVVNQTPATPAASSNSPVCSGNSLTLTASTSTPSVTWSWSGPNGFTSTSQNPSVSATATTAMGGTYNVIATATYTTTNTLNCPSATASTIVVVNPTPAISSSSLTNPTNCASATGTIILNGLNASTSYTVNYTNSFGAQTSTITSSASGVITIQSLPAGTYSNVFVVLSNCPSASVGPFSLVDPTPPATPTIPNVNPLCSGNTLNLSASTTSTGTQTWSWNGPNSFTSTQQNPIIVNASTLATGTYNVTVTISGCTSPAGTINVIVNQTPATPTPSSNTPVCTGNALTLTASTSSTMPVTWSWTGPNSFTSTSQNPQVSTSATLAMAGTYNVTATASYTTTTTLNCPSTTASTIVVVNPTPAINSSSFTNPTNCASSTGTIILNGLTASTSYTVNYTNSAGAQTATITSSSTGVITIPSLLAGTYSNVYVVLTNCPSAPVGPFNLVDPTPPSAPTATNNSAICDGESLQLNASTNEPGTPTWNWTGPNAFTSSLQNPQITSATLINAGTYNVTVTINSCTSPAGATTVIVNPRPAAPIVNSTVIYCQNVVPVALTATALPGHTLTWYTSSTGVTGSAIAPTPSTSTVGTVSYFVSQTTPLNCEGPRAQIDVIVNPTPVVSNQSQTICSGASFTISPNGTSSVPSNTLYSWGLPAVTGGLTGGATGTSQSNIIGTLFNPTDFVHTATYTVTSISGSCPGNTFTVVISVNPAPRIIFSLPGQSICSGDISQAVTLTSPTPGAIIPWTSIQPTGINGVTLSGSGTIPAQTLINTTPNPITVTYTATASTTGTSACPGTPTPYQIVVTPTPVIPNTTETICSGGFFNVQPANSTTTIVPSGTTYTWTVSSNSNITGQANQTIAQTEIADTLTNISNVPQTIVYTVTPKSGIADSCVGQTFTITVTVNPKPVIPTITQTVCSGNAFLLNPINGQPNANTIVPNATVYNWSAPTLPVGMTGAASGTNQTTISGTLLNTNFAPITITYVVTPTSGDAGSCVGLPFNVEITVNPLASISNNPLSQSVCNDNTTTSVNWSSFTAGSTYSWTLVSFGNVTGYQTAGNGPTLVAMTLSNTGIAQDSVVYAVSSTASACAGPATNYTIYVNPDANANFTYPYDTACWPYAIVINNTSPLSPGNINIPNSSYNWYTINQLGTETLIGTGSIFPGYSIPGPSDSIKIKMVSISAFGCKNDSLTHTFFTKPKPTAAFTMSNRDSCGPLTISFVNQTNIRDTFRYQWNFGNGQTSTATNPAPVTYLSNPRFFDTTYYITLRAFNECDTTTYIDSVIVRADPKARFSVSSSSGCSPFTIQIINSSLGNPHTYYWDFGDGTPILTTTTLGSLSHTYYTGIVDTFELKLVAISACGRDSQIIKIRVAPNVIIPGVSVTATELYGCVSHSVNFNNTSTGATNFIWDFGDGTPLQPTNFFQTIVNHTYNTAGTFNVLINMTNGCSDTSINTSITVYPRPTAAFTTSQTVYCLGDTTRFINNSINATNYTWSLGNGVFNTNFQPNYLYLNPGVYNIQLEAQQSNATGLVCFDTITRSITILSKPDTAIITNIRPVNCSPFIITGSVPGYTTESITWYVYDTTLPIYPVVISNPILNYTFNNSGRFKVVMVIENASGCKDSTFRFLSVYAKPVAAFTPLNLATCSLDTIVSYVNNTTANIYTPLTYRWYVDGIQRATSGNFTYRYTALPTDILPRIFNTKLVAINSVGCADSITGALQISPTAKSIFTLNNPQACIPFVAAINNNSTYATNYQWYLNGVLVSTNENPNINITTADTSYTVTLIVSNIYACRPDTSSYIFRTRVMPIAAFSFNDTLGCTGQLAVVTTNTSQHANAYTWQWGDASPNSTLFNPTHLFTSVGNFNTTLTASDGVCTDTLSHAVVVSQKPTANFIANNVKNCDTSGVRFINLTANATSFIWTVSNGFTTTETSPTITLPPSATSYSVTLLAINADGCRDSLTRANYIKVYALPPADFTITPSSTIYIPNYTFGFLNLTPDNPMYKYNWSLGDGTFAITRDVVSHLYNDTGNYEVRLTVLDTTTSCVDTVIKYARILGYPGYLYVPNAFYANSTQLNFKYFKPLGKGLAEYELLIFDSWGKLLFRTTKLDYAGSPVDGWDGTFKGAPMPQDAYAWKIKARFRNGKVWEGMNYDQSQEKQPAHSFGTLTLFR